MTLYRTIDGDMVDAICHHHYGTSEHTAAVYDDNPGLAELGPVLPAGILVLLPEIARDPIERPIRLWGR